jgi:hypothetical protein
MSTIAVKDFCRSSNLSRQLFEMLLKKAHRCGQYVTDLTVIGSR